MGIDLPWPFVAEGYLMAAFLPLAAVAVFCGRRYRHARRGTDPAARRNALVALVAVCVPLAGSGAGWVFYEGNGLVSGLELQAYLRDHTRVLQAPETIGNVSFPAGASVTNYGEHGAPLEIRLPGPATVGGIPTIGRVEVYPDSGLTGTLTLTRAVTIDGLPCAAGDGVAFSHGKVIRCHLSHEARVRGVPCAGDVDLEATFECTLASPYRSHGILYGAGTQWQILPAATVATVGKNPPDFRVFGKALSQGTIVRYKPGSIDINFQMRMGSWYGEKAVYHMSTRTVTEEDYIGTTAPLPASTFSFARVPTE